MDTFDLGSTPDDSGNIQQQSTCVICGGINQYERLKMWPCTNKQCKWADKFVSDVCNQCIRNLQRNKIECKVCHKSATLTNEFGHFQYPYLRHLDICILTSKHLKTQMKTYNQATQSFGEPIPQISLPILSYLLEHFSECGEMNKKVSEGKPILRPLQDEAQSFSIHVNSETKAVFEQNQITSYFLEQIYNTCKMEMTRCGSNQVLLTGGYQADLNFIQGTSIHYSYPQVLQLWQQYQRNEITQDYLQQKLDEILNGYQFTIQQATGASVPVMLPITYPYIGNNYMLTFQDDVDGQKFVVDYFPQLEQSRSNHQTIVTKNKVFVLGGICNGYVLNTIECCTIKREISDQIVRNQPSDQQFFNIVQYMFKPRSNFTAVLKPGIECDGENCRYIKKITTDPKPYNCQNPKCHNPEFIYYYGGQSVYGQILDQGYMERINTETLVVQQMLIDEKKSSSSKYHGLSLGVWKQDLFLFGGVPKEQYKDSVKNSCFYLLKPSTGLGTEEVIQIEEIANDLGLCHLPQFTVSVPYNETDPKKRELSPAYRLFIVAYKVFAKFKVEMYKIIKDVNGKIILSSQVNSITEKTKLVKEEWRERGFFEEQSFALLNSQIDR